MSDQLDFLLDRYLSTKMQKAGRRVSGPLSAAQQAMLQTFLRGPIRLPLPPAVNDEPGGMAARNGDAALPEDLLRELDEHERQCDPPEERSPDAP